MSNSRMAREYAALYHRLVSAADADAPEVSVSDAESMHHLPALKALKYSTTPPRAAQGSGKRKNKVAHLVLGSSKALERMEGVVPDSYHPRDEPKASHGFLARRVRHILSALGRDLGCTRASVKDCIPDEEDGSQCKPPFAVDIGPGPMRRTTYFATTVLEAALRASSQQLAMLERHRSDRKQGGDEEDQGRGKDEEAAFLREGLCELVKAGPWIEASAHIPDLISLVAYSAAGLLMAWHFPALVNDADVLHRTLQRRHLWCVPSVSISKLTECHQLFLTIHAFAKRSGTWQLSVKLPSA